MQGSGMPRVLYWECGSWPLWVIGSRQGPTGWQDQSCWLCMAVCMHVCACVQFYTIAQVQNTRQVSHKSWQCRCVCTTTPGLLKLFLHQALSSFLPESPHTIYLEASCGHAVMFSPSIWLLLVTGRNSLSGEVREDKAWGI